MGLDDFIKKNYKLILGSIFLISFILHERIFNLDLVGIHVWRQTETQTVINNFYRDDFNILNPKINGFADTNQLHRIEFPIMQWLFALFYKILGPHIVISRALNFMIGLCCMYGMFYLCDSIFKNKIIATICAWCFNFSPVFYYYTMNPMPDTLALCCGIWSITFFYMFINTTKIKYVIWSAFFLCIATLAKLPFILYSSFIITFIVISWMRKIYTRKQLLNASLIYAIWIIPALAWYMAVIPNWQMGAVKGVFDQRWNHPVLLHVLTGTLISILPELLINYGSMLFFIAGFYLMFKSKIYRNQIFLSFLVWGISLILYFLFEMNIIDLVHDYYLFPFLPAIFLLVAYGGYNLLRSSNFFKYISLLCFTILPITAYLRADSRWDTKDPGFNPAYFKYKNELRNLTPKNSLCIVGNDPSNYILLYYIDRKGWAFDKDCLDQKMLSYDISKGAHYLFLDDYIDTLPEIKTHLTEKIFDKETLRVYKLK
jgi:hypothetical protein